MCEQQMVSEPQLPAAMATRELEAEKFQPVYISRLLSDGHRSPVRDRQLPPPGRTDLLLRFFDSQFFDEWIALFYLHTSTSTGVHDYICNRMYAMPEASVERFLLQLTTLVLQRPGSTLERLLLDLCSRSLCVAVKTYWLLLSRSQDDPEVGFLLQCSTSKSFGCNPQAFVCHARTLLYLIIDSRARCVRKQGENQTALS